MITNRNVCNLTKKKTNLLKLLFDCKEAVIKFFIASQSHSAVTQNYFLRSLVFVSLTFSFSPHSAHRHNKLFRSRSESTLVETTEKQPAPSPKHQSITLPTVQVRQSDVNNVVIDGPAFDLNRHLLDVASLTPPTVRASVTLVIVKSILVRIVKLSPRTLRIWVTRSLIDWRWRDSERDYGRHVSIWAWLSVMSS